MGLFSWLFGRDNSPSVRHADKGHTPAVPKHSSESSPGIPEMAGPAIPLSDWQGLPPDMLDQAYDQIKASLIAEEKRRAEKLKAGDLSGIDKKASGKRSGVVRFSTAFAPDSVGCDPIVEREFRQIISQVQPKKSFGNMLVQYVRERCGGNASQCYRRAGVSRQLYSLIISDPNKTVTKRTALQLCIGLRLNRAEAEVFLSFAGYSFSPSSLEDMAFSWCLEHADYSMIDINYFLTRGGKEAIPLN